MKIKTKKDYRVRRHLRLRKKIKGTASRPRMSVFKSNKNICVQCIDDTAGKTLASCSTMSAAMKGVADRREVARMLGKDIAEQLVSQGVDTAVFDNGGFGYKGKIKDVAEAAREAGLKI